MTARCIVIAKFPETLVCRYQGETQIGPRLGIMSEVCPEEHGSLPRRANHVLQNVAIAIKKLAITLQSLP